jgi:hypothetical protein
VGKMRAEQARSEAAFREQQSNVSLCTSAQTWTNDDAQYSVQGRQDLFAALDQFEGADFA